MLVSHRSTSSANLLQGGSILLVQLDTESIPNCGKMVWCMFRTARAKVDLESDHLSRSVFKSLVVLGLLGLRASGIKQCHR